MQRHRQRANGTLDSVGGSPQSVNTFATAISPPGTGKHQSNASQLGFASGDSLKLSPVSGHLKLPRPRSWVNNLAKLTSPSSSAAGSSSIFARQRQNTIDGPLTTPPPVSSLILQDTFYSEDKSRVEKALPELDLHYGRLADGHQNSRGFISTTDPRSSIGNLKAATLSTPDLGSSSGLASSRRKPVSYAAPDSRELMQEPSISSGGVYNDFLGARSIQTHAEVIDKMVVSDSDPFKSNRFITPDEEEAMLDKAVQRDQEQGKLGFGEHAVLDMLNRSNERAAASMSAEAEDSPQRRRADESSTFSAPSHVSRYSDNSAHGISVRDFASDFGGKDEGKDERPISSLSKTSSRNNSAQPSFSPSRGSVRRAVENREKLDQSANAPTKSLLALPSQVNRNTVPAFMRGKSFESSIQSDTSVASTDLTEHSHGCSASPEPSRPRIPRQESSPGPRRAYYGEQTNAFLERRPTQAADRYLWSSPGHSSFASSSAHATSSSLWSRPAAALPDSPGSHSPSGLPGSRDALPFAYGLRKRQQSHEDHPPPPLLRRLRTDATAATGLSSLMEPASSSKENVIATEGMDMTGVGTRSAHLKVRASESRAASKASSVTSSSSPVRSLSPLENSPSSLYGTAEIGTTRTSSPQAKFATVRSYDSSDVHDTLRASKISSHFHKTKEDNAAEGLPSSMPETPKKAKDLIRMFEQGSVPSSPTTRSVQSSPKKTFIDSPNHPSTSLRKDFDRFRTTLGPSPALKGALTAAAGQDTVNDQRKNGSPLRAHQHLVNCNDSVVSHQAGPDSNSGDLLLKKPKAALAIMSEENAEDENTAPLSISCSRTVTPRKALQGLPRELSERSQITAQVKTSYSPKGSLHNWGTSTQGNSLTSSRTGTSLLRQLPDGKTSVDSAHSRAAHLKSSDVTTTLLSTPEAPATIGKENDRSGDNDRKSTTSSQSSGTSAAFHQRRENGNLPVDAQATLALMGQQGVAPLRTGLVYYLNVHVKTPTWQRAQAVLLPGAIALSWIPAGGGRVSIVLDLKACREVQSIAGPEHRSSVGDSGDKAALLQGLARISPWQLTFDDGVERMAVESACDRVQWVGAVWKALGQGKGERQLRPAKVWPFADPNTKVADVLMSPPRLSSSGTLQSTKAVPFGATTGNPPQLPPKDIKGKRQFVDSCPSQLFDKHDAQVEHLKTRSGTLQTTPALSLATTNHDDDFGPRSPPNSEACFGWNAQDNEIAPADSASQRPQRTGSVSSRFSATGSGRPQKEGSQTFATQSVPTAAQTVRDAYRATPPATLSRERQNVVNDSKTQAATTTRINTTQEIDALTPLAVNETSQATNGIVASRADSEDVAGLLSYFEQQEAERRRRDEHLDAQLRDFQDAVRNLCRETRKRGRRSSESDQQMANIPRSADNASNVATAASVTADAAALVAMQQKLDRVLSLVSSISDEQTNLEKEVGASTQGPKPPSLRAGSDISKIELTLQTLVDRVQTESSRSLYDQRHPRRIDPELNAHSKQLAHVKRQNRRVSAPANMGATDVDDDIFMTPSLGGDAEFLPNSIMTDVKDPRLAAPSPNAPAATRLSPQDGAHLLLRGAPLGLSSKISSNAADLGIMRSSQAIQTPAVEDRGGLNADLVMLLDAIKKTDAERKAQQKQQEDIARYLNELNSWLERDVVDRSKEWRTLALGVTQLHHELSSIKDGAGFNSGAAQTGTSARAGGERNVMGVDSAQSGSLALEAMNQATSSPLRPFTSYVDSMAAISNPQAQLDPGADHSTPLALPGPTAPVKRSGTRTWRAKEAPASLRNDDVWTSSGSVKSRSERREEKKAAGRARRRESLSKFSRLAAAAGGAALVGAATHEYDKYKQRQREEGKPEEASREPDAATGEYATHDEVPIQHSEKIVQAAQNGDEGQVREAIREAAEAGAGASAISRFMDEIRKRTDSDAERNGNNGSHDVNDDADGTEDDDGHAIDREENDTVTRTAKSSSASAQSGGPDSLRNAVQGLEAGAGGGALALAVEEILKHLIERKEEERRKQKALEEEEAQREAARRQEEMEREERLGTLRDREKNELVETIFAKLQAETARQQADEAARQREMDPKSAIESLVTAINSQRQADAVQKATADDAMRQMASDLVKTTSEQNGKLVDAVHGAAREMLRHNVEVHADELKGILGKEVTAMFEDVGKIREAKRALELEMADLFQIKSKHLLGLEELRTVTSTAAAGSNAPAPPQPTAVPMRALPPMPQPKAVGNVPGSISMPMTTPAMPDMPMGAVPSARPPMPPPPRGAGHKRDFVAPFSISFGPRTR